MAAAAVGRSSLPLVQPLLDVPKAFWAVATFCTVGELMTLMRVSKRLHELVGHDHVWTQVIDTHLLTVLRGPADASLGSLQWLRQIMTDSKFLSGSYAFTALAEQQVSNVAAATVVLQGGKGVVGFRGNGATRARVSVRFTNGNRERYDGVLRFSFATKGWILATCSVTKDLQAAGAGPTFSGFFSIAKRPWGNESRDAFRRGGLRLVLSVTASPKPIQVRADRVQLVPVPLLSAGDNVAVTRECDDHTYLASSPTGSFASSGPLVSPSGSQRTMSGSGSQQQGPASGAGSSQLAARVTRHRDAAAAADEEFSLPKLFSRAFGRSSSRSPF